MKCHVFIFQIARGNVLKHTNVQNQPCFLQKFPSLPPRGQAWHLGGGEAQSKAARKEITIVSAPASPPGSERKALSWR